MCLLSYFEFLALSKIVLSTNYFICRFQYIQLFTTSWTAVCQASLSFTVSQSLFKLTSIESVMPFDRLTFCCPLLLLLSIFPSIRDFNNESALCLRWPKQSFSLSNSPSNYYSELISFGLTGWISLQSKGFSRAFSSTTIRKHHFFDTQPSFWSSCHFPT